MYKVILAIRYLVRRRITYLAMAAVALCVFIVVVVMTVMTGLVTDFKQKNHRFAGDCVVGTESLVGFAYYEDFMKALEEEDFVEEVSPVIRNYALLNLKGTERNISVEITGIDPVRHNAVSGFGQTLHYHKDDADRAFSPFYDANLVGCVIGIDLVLSRDSQGQYDYGDSPMEMELSISCFPLTARGALAKADTGLVNTKTFYYSDTSESGLARVDSSMVYLPFEEAQALCGMGGLNKRASSLHIRFKPEVKLDDGCGKVELLWRKFVQEKTGGKQAELLEGVRVQSWREYRRAFIAAMEKEQTVMTVMFALVGVTTIFIVFVVFYMIVSHKSKDIGVLKSIGASGGDIIELFSGFAFLVGLFGSSVGVLCGWLFLLKINRIEDFLYEHFKFQLWDRTIYIIGDIPNRMELDVVAVIIVSAIISCLAGAIVPSWEAARLEPVEALRVSRL